MNSAFKLVACTGEGHLKSKNRTFTRIHHYKVYWTENVRHLYVVRIAGFIQTQNVAKAKFTPKICETRSVDDVLSATTAVALKYLNFRRIDRGNGALTISSSNQFWIFDLVREMLLRWVFFFDRSFGADDTLSATRRVIFEFYVKIWQSIN